MSTTPATIVKLIALPATVLGGRLGSLAIANSLPLRGTIEVPQALFDRQGCD